MFEVVRDAFGMEDDKRICPVQGCSFLPEKPRKVSKKNLKFKISGGCRSCRRLRRPRYISPIDYAESGGEFEAKVKVSGDCKVRFDRAGLMIRIDYENNIKPGKR